MQVTQFRAEVYAEGFSEQRAFSIDASGKAFKGLIDGIYSRKIEAIIRELSTNAYDAQIDAAYIGPFETHLPTTFSPVFWVRDFGTGMTHEQVMTRYTRLFNSTKDGGTASDYDATTTEGIKREANKQVGQLGLGSKVFFSYTDACTLTVWQDGIKRVYSVFMGGDGVPQVALAGAIDSDEPVGVKVEFAVKTKDLLEFRKAAARVYKGFPYVPMGLGTHTLSELGIEPTMLGNGWKAFPEGYLPDVPYYAKQGCVLYPIDLAQLDSKAIENADGELVLSATFEQYKKTKITIILDFPIGSINFDLSRERLSYDDITVKALLSGWNKFHADISRSFASKFEGVRGGYQLALIAKQENTKDFGPLFAVTPQATAIEITKEALSASFPEYTHQREKTIFPICFFVDSSDRLVKFRDRRPLNAPAKKEMLGALYIYDDEKVKNVQLRLRLYMQNNGYKYAFVFGSKTLTLRNVRKLGDLPIMRMSLLPELPKAEKEKLTARFIGGGFKRFKRIDASGDYTSMSQAEITDLDPEDTFYVLINRGHIVREHDHLYLSDKVSSANAFLKSIGLGNIVAINTRSNESEDRWSAVDYPRFTECVDHVLDNITKTELTNFATYFNYMQYHSSIYPNACSVIMTLKGKGNPITAMRRYDTQYNKLSKSESFPWKLLSEQVTGNQSWDKKFVQDSLFDQIYYGIIEQCRDKGIELLLPMASTPGRGILIASDHRLLSKKWHNLAVALNGGTFEIFKRFYCKAKLKEYNVPC